MTNVNELSTADKLAMRSPKSMSCPLLLRFQLVMSCPLLMSWR